MVNRVEMTHCTASIVTVSILVWIQSTVWESGCKLLLFCFLPVPLRLPKLLDLSECELLLPSPAEPDFTLFPFSRGDRKETQHKLVKACWLELYSRCQHPWSITGLDSEHSQSQRIKQLLHGQTVCVCGGVWCVCVISRIQRLRCEMPTFFGYLPEFKSYCEGLGYRQSHSLSLENRREIHFVTDREQKEWTHADQQDCVTYKMFPVSLSKYFLAT